MRNLLAERRFTSSLRFRVAVGVALPVFVALGALSLLLYTRERQILLDQLEDTAIRLGEVMRGSLRHAMLTRNDIALDEMLTDIGGQQSVLRVAVVNAAGQVVLTDRPADFVTRPDRPTTPGCMECHKTTETLSRHSAVVNLPGQAPVLRSSILIPNDPDCYGCHASSQIYLGVLIADFSLSDLEHDAATDLRLHLLLSTFATALVTLGVYILVQRLVVRRVESFQQPLRQFAQGDFSERLPLPKGQLDELGSLARAVNQMADGLQQQAALERQARDARLQATVEERQRLARELHDGLAQVLGFVNAKASAVRLLLQGNQTAQAVGELRQLEEASRAVFADLREAILNLNTTPQGDRGLVKTLDEYLSRFHGMSGIQTELRVEPGAEQLPLAPEIEIQLLRIVQEALTNVRKHAGASRAWVKLAPNGGQTVCVTIGDDGRGFDLSGAQTGDALHYGLASMRERAEAAGGRFRVDSAPGAGTRVTVNLPLWAGERNLT